MCVCNQDSSVITRLMIDYGLEGRCSIPVRRRSFLFAVPKPILKASQLTVQQVPVVFFPGINQSERETITHIHLMPRLKVRNTVSQSPIMHYFMLN
jgi:hypothetical protein